MLEYYRSIGGKLHLVDDYMEGCWINAIAPSLEEIDYLHHEIGIPVDYLNYPLDVDERPRFEKEDDFILFLIQTSFPLGDHSDIPYDTIPLGIIHCQHCIVTVCAQDNPIIQDMKKGMVRYISTAKKNRFTLQLFHRTAQRYLVDLRKINKQVDTVEDQLENSTRNQELLALLKLEKSLVYFKTAIKSNEIMMERVRRDRVFEMYADDQELLDDVIIENQQAIEMTDIATQILASMMGAFASVISNNVNSVMKVMTVATIMVAIPTLITSLYGMNVPIPFQDTHWSFYFVLLVGALAVGVLWYFVRRAKWW
ncbi:magnesium transporter CorA family protein [Deinococcus misasensis]|uniref:magnesium transporter CorA family protein n=1 Tax=Deinococcus misasensis TaxID=392413 RepID=UPI00054FE46B|nr:magnesium transporter CorA family protein [Deinococcus misasensis]